MDSPEDFEWDDAKATKNLRDHGVTFEYSTAIFLDPNALRVDTTRKEDREAREKMIGQIDEKLFTVVFTLRGSAVRIISARRSNKREETAYGKSII